MASGKSSKKTTRQFKALSSLVLSMTLGTFLLNWLMGPGPSRSNATTLRSVSQAATWDRILVHSVSAGDQRPDGSIRGFHHLLVAGDGTVAKSDSWESGRYDPHARGAIRVAVMQDPGRSLTPRQWKQLSDVLGQLQRQYGISKDRIQVDARRGHDRSAEPLDAMLKTR